MPEQLPKEIADDTPATKLVYITLASGAVLDQDGLKAHTGLSIRSIGDVANDLSDRGLITFYRHPRDQRKKIYFDPDQLDAIDAHREYVAQKQPEK